MEEIALNFHMIIQLDYRCLEVIKFMLLHAEEMNLKRDVLFGIAERLNKKGFITNRQFKSIAIAAKTKIMERVDFMFDRFANQR